MTTTIRKRIQQLRPCPGPGMKWLGERTDVRLAWAECQRGNDMLWLAAMLGIDRRLVVLAACDCAATADPNLDVVARGTARFAIETARKWCCGEVARDEVLWAAEDAHAVSDDRICGPTAATHAACAATKAARSAHVSNIEDHAVLASIAADHAAVSAAYSAANYADQLVYADSIRSDTLSRCAVLVRKHITARMIEEALGRIEVSKPEQRGLGEL